jgi:hypothetical protein
MLGRLSRQLARISHYGLEGPDQPLQIFTVPELPRCGQLVRVVITAPSMFHRGRAPSCVLIEFVGVVKAFYRSRAVHRLRHLKLLR